MDIAYLGFIQVLWLWIPGRERLLSLGSNKEWN